MSGADELAVLCEVATDSPAGCRAAEEGGARRVELCAALVEGGTTPSAATIERALAATVLPVFVLVRPRGGDFRYDADEHATVRRDVELVRAAGAAGVVVGALDAEGRVDVERARELVALARPLAVTFHRAFDHARDLDEALEDLVRAGVDRVLTSGGEQSAHEGAAVIARLVARARGRIAVMAGGGVRPEGVRALVESTGVREIHVSARRAEASPVRGRRAGPRLGADRVPREDERIVPDAERVRSITRALELVARPRPT